MVKLPLTNKDGKYIGYIYGDFAQKYASLSTSEISKYTNVEYTLVYEDQNNNPIGNFLPFTMDDYDAFIKENIAPYNAEHIGIYDNSNSCIGEIYLNDLYTGDSPERLYRVGLMSDIHYEVTDEDGDPDLSWTGTGSECYLDVKNALRYYAGKAKADNKVDFIAASGDVSTNYLSHVRNFWLMTRTYGEGIPFFSCYGNHDYCAVTAGDTEVGDNNFGLIDPNEKMTRVRHWNYLMFDERINKTDDTIFDIEHYDDNPNSLGYSTFLFKKALDKSNKDLYDIYIFLSVDYDNKNDTTARTPIRYNSLIGDVEQISDSSPITLDLFEIDGTKDGYRKYPGQTTIGSDNEWNVKVQFTGQSQRFYINYKYIDFATNKVSIENIKIIDGTGNDVTELLLSKDNPKIGFYGTDGIYHLDGVVNVNIIDGKLEFPCSSTFNYATFPLTVYMNAHLINDSIQINHNKVYKYVYDNIYKSGSPADRNYSYGYEGYYDLQFYNPGVLLWLANRLEMYKNKRVFIFTHLFFPHKSGTNNNYIGYKYSEGISRINSSYSYCLCGIQFDLLNYLNNTYNKTIWFTGHSHYKWEWQIVDPDINVSNTEYLFYNPAENDFVSGKNPENLRYMRKTEQLEMVGQWWEAWKSGSAIAKDTVLTCQMLTEPGKEYHILVDLLAINQQGTTQNWTAKKGTTVGEIGLVLSANESPLLVYDVPMHIDTYTPSQYKFDFTAKENITKLKFTITKENIVNWLVIRVNGEISDLEYYIIPEVNNMQYQTGSQLPKDIDFRLEKTNNTAYNVHLPSTSRPIPLGRSTYGVADEDAQGAIMDVYKDFVDIRGIVFKDNEIKNDGYQESNVQIPISVITQEKDTSTGYTGTAALYSGEYSIIIVFNGPGQRCFIDISELEKRLKPNTSSDTIVWNKNYSYSSGGFVVQVNINTLKLVDQDGNIDISEVSNKVGFHVSTNPSGTHNLVLKQPVNKIATIEVSEFHNSGKIAIECSKDATNLNYPITLGLNLDMNLTYTTNYINKYIPIGQYRIPIKAS